MQSMQASNKIEPLDFQLLQLQIVLLLYYYFISAGFWRLVTSREDIPYLLLQKILSLRHTGDFLTV